MEIDKQIEMNMIIQAVVDKALSDNILYLKAGLERDNVDFRLIEKTIITISDYCIEECRKVDKSNTRNIFTLVTMAMLKALIKLQEKELMQFIKDKGITKEMLYTEMLIDMNSLLKG